MARIYVGNLPLDIRTRDIEDLFWKYGRIRDIDCKTPSRPPAFAFVSFEKFEDAEDAIRGRDGVQFEGQRLRVEMSRGSSDSNDDRGSSRRFEDRRGDRYGGGGGGGGGGGPPPRPSRPPPRDLRRSEHRVIVSGLPPSASWQDLKDFFRPAGDVIYTDVDGQGGGIVEFANKADQEFAVTKLDDTEFKNPFDKCYIRVKKPKDQVTDADRERSKERERDRSRDRSRGRDRSRRSRSKSKSKSRSRSRSEPRRGRGGDDDEDKPKAKESSPAKEDSAAKAEDGPVVHDD